MLGSSWAQAKPHKHNIKIDDPLHTTYPILSDMKYFSYKNMNASEVTIKSLLAFNGPYIMSMYHQDPEKVFNFLCLMILVEKSLQGTDVERMLPKDRHDMAISQITIYLRKYGYIDLLNDFDGNSKPSKIVPPEDLCRMAEDVKEAIFSERNHYRHVFDGM